MYVLAKAVGKIKTLQFKDRFHQNQLEQTIHEILIIIGLN